MKKTNKSKRSKDENLVENSISHRLAELGSGNKELG